MTKGACTCSALIFVNIAVQRGKAGPSHAISGTQSIFQAILCWLIMGQEIHIIDIVALTLGFCGLLTISIGDYIYKSFKSKDSLDDTIISERKLSEKFLK